ncbi:hypothetical protein GCM10007160_18510 [Litchfieldella qijiaojingensis]|uniref:Uncharacterized protein n=1 Tax=Litchfieldella qijiaojingensis TaxID=980347 RepID=A0ABQ2YRM0_9GAMM|nr:hypothetical protein [Halomonas qijiaojingensis]GGX91308.1 hypothetical protein GCM10007160_18510 [Halomonas qijiaojingensis]
MISHSEEKQVEHLIDLHEKADLGMREVDQLIDLLIRERQELKSQVAMSKGP